MKVVKLDLVGDITKFPLHVVQLMVNEQARQGNPADPRVFAGNDHADKAHGGFDWNESEAGTNFWWQVIALKRYNLASEPEQVHPISESENHTQTEATPEPAKPKRKIVQVSAAVTTVAKVDEYLEYQGTESYVVAICDDGTVWECTDSGNWYKLHDIPQDGE